MLRPIALTALAFGAGLSGSSVAEGQKYTVETRIYRVLTNISGESSQTLPCSTADIVHKLNEDLDGITLRMEGDALKWDRFDEPRSPLIQRVAEHHGTMTEGEADHVVRTADTEYFERVEDDWEFSKMEWIANATDFTFRPEPDRPGVIRNTYSLKLTYIKERAPVPGIRTLNVGKPTLASIESKGTWLFRLGEWSCLRAQVPSEGRLYIFLMVRECGPDTDKN